jgi:hypothetical protein
MDDARAALVSRLLRILVRAFALWVAIEALDFRRLDPEVPRYVLDAPADHASLGDERYKDPA